MNCLELVPTRSPETSAAADSRGGPPEFPLAVRLGQLSG